MQDLNKDIEILFGRTKNLKLLNTRSIEGNPYFEYCMIDGISDMIQYVMNTQDSIRRSARDVLKK